jgi:hypothetical protein
MVGRSWPASQQSWPWPVEGADWIAHSTALLLEHMGICSSKPGTSGQVLSCDFDGVLSSDIEVHGVGEERIVGQSIDAQSPSIRC